MLVVSNNVKKIRKIGNLTTIYIYDVNRMEMDVNCIPIFFYNKYFVIMK